MKLAPRTYYPYYNYGIIYRSAGDSVKAVEYFEKAVQLSYRENDLYDLLLDYYLTNDMNEKASELKKSFGY